MSFARKAKILRWDGATLEPAWDMFATMVGAQVLNLYSGLLWSCSTIQTSFMAAPEEIHQSQEKCPMWLDWLNLLDHLIWSVNLISLIWDQVDLIWDQLDLIWDQLDLICDQLDLICLIRIKRPDGNLWRICNPAAICTLVEDDRGTTHWSLQLFK